MYDVVSLGELLIDFSPVCVDGDMLFKRNPGGAPPNVLACMANFGLQTALIAKVGDDMFGQFLINQIKAYKIDTIGIVKDKKTETTLAFVQIGEDGDRDFSFYRSLGADKFITEDDIDFSMIENTKIFHYGALSMTDDPSRTTTIALAKKAVELGKIVSYDPNWRRPLWRSEEEGLRWMKEGMTYANIVKVSEEELSLITKAGKMETIENIEEGLDILLKENPNIKVIACTQGEKGCVIANRQNKKVVPGISQYRGKAIKAVDTTGAGDCFIGTLLTNILKSGKLDTLTIDELASFAYIANKAAAICCTRPGGIPAMPTAKEIHD